MQVSIYVKVVYVRVSICKCEIGDFTLAPDIPKRYQTKDKYISKKVLKLYMEIQQKSILLKLIDFAEP